LPLRRSRRPLARLRPALFDEHTLLGAGAGYPDNRAVVADPLRACNWHGLRRTQRQKRR